MPHGATLDNIYKKKTYIDYLMLFDPFSLFPLHYSLSLPMISRWPCCRPLPVRPWGSSAAPLCSDRAHGSSMHTTSTPPPHSALDAACAHRWRYTSLVATSPVVPCHASPVAASPLGRLCASPAVAASCAGPRHHEGVGGERLTEHGRE